MDKIINPRGTADILPAQMAAWSFLETTARRVFAAYGYGEMRTPLFEETGLFQRSLGEHTEVVNKQLLEVRAQRGEAEASAGLALRPEGTAAVVRAYNQYDLGRNEYLSRLFYMGPMFRGERPQKGRLRQFHQIGAEAIGRGASHPLLDAEMIALAVTLLKEFGLGGFSLRLNSLGTVEDKLTFARWLREQLRDKIGGLSEECRAQYERNVFRLLDSKDRACQDVISSLVIGRRHLSAGGAAYFDAVLSGLDRLGVAYEVSDRLVRGLDYYTHTVFEISCAGLGAQDAVGAGGRYDGLVEQLGGGDRRVAGSVGAIGFALGMERILLALEAQGKSFAPPAPLDAFVVYGTPELEAAAFSLLAELRAAGISGVMDFGGRGLKKQFEQAGKISARLALLLGEQEHRDGLVVVKNMTSGVQRPVPRAALMTVLHQELPLAASGSAGG